MAPLYPILNKRIPRRYLYIGGMISMIVAYVLLVLFYIPGTLIQMTAILSLTDSIEYGQLKNGKRNEAVTLSVRCSTRSAAPCPTASSASSPSPRA